MRSIETGGGRHNIRNVGIFLWRVQALRLAHVPLTAADASQRRYRFDPLGTDRRLFQRPRTEEEISHIAEPLDVPLALSVRRLSDHVAALYGADLSLVLWTESGPVGIDDVRVCSLADDPATPGAWAHEPQPADTFVVVDPELGRVAYPAATAAGAERRATFHHGAALAIGGGGYDRTASVGPVPALARASGGEALAPRLATIASGGTLQIDDCDAYAAPASITVSVTPPAASAEVVVRAANRQRPLLQRDDQVRLRLDPHGVVTLDGLVLAGAPLVVEESADNEPRTLVLRHCTLVPGLRRTTANAPTTPDAASLVVLHPFTEVVLEHCVSGPIVAVEGAKVTIRDSIVDAGDEHAIAYCGRAPVLGGLRGVSTVAERKPGDGLVAGGALTLDACTVVGRVHAEEVGEISNSILLAAPAVPGPDSWPAPVWVRRRQQGCVRFSFVPPGSRTPHRYACVGGDPAHRPQHTSLRFGDPAFGQLDRVTHDAVRTGADDESEIGATHELHQPQRETNLRLRLDEYLRFGLQAGFFYAT
jgi:hypothetical protein